MSTPHQDPASRPPLPPGLGSEPGMSGWRAGLERLEPLTRPGAPSFPGPATVSGMSRQQRDRDAGSCAPSAWSSHHTGPHWAPVSTRLVPGGVNGEPMPRFGAQKIHGCLHLLCSPWAASSHLRRRAGDDPARDRPRERGSALPGDSGNPVWCHQQKDEESVREACLPAAQGWPTAPRLTSLHLA